MRRIIFQIHHFPDIVTRGRIRFRSVVIYLGSLFPYTAPSLDGERAWPLANVLLGAKHGERLRSVSRIIVKKYCAL